MNNYEQFKYWNELRKKYRVDLDVKERRSGAVLEIWLNPVEPEELVKTKEWFDICEIFHSITKEKLTEAIASLIDERIKAKAIECRAKVLKELGVKDYVDFVKITKLTEKEVKGV